MRILEPSRFEHGKRQRKRNPAKHALRLIVVLIIIAALCVFAALRYLSPVMTATAQMQAITIPAKKIDLAWPKYGQAAVGARGYKVLAANGKDEPLPTASIAKVMTAFSVLKHYPLAPGEQGPTLTLTAADVQIYNDYVAKDGSNVPVQAGEKITEYQAIQALLLPSANNMADSLAIWAFGSIDAYVDFANNLAKSIGLTKSHFADASGFSAKTVSTSRDLVLLGEAILQNDVMAEIVAQQSADIPVAGTIKNVNFALGVEGINGIKTGNTEEAGGCFLVSAVHTYPGGQKVVAVAAVQGAPNLYTALQDTLPLLKSVFAGFGSRDVAARSQTVGTYTVGWEGPVAARTAEQVKIFGWLGSELKVSPQLSALTLPASEGQGVGKLSVQDGPFTAESSVVLSRSVAQPTRSWRLKHVFM